MAAPPAGGGAHRRVDPATGGLLRQSDLGGARCTVSGLPAQGGGVTALLSSATYGGSLHVPDAADEPFSAFRRR
ncbi:hypothetical protein ACFV1L_03965 [Kitasatospora sp. NPDC059646]|uniref:hypothetical protein n=1 Tax=Kitasatospora sp. NPDC059646 TaxID=3346893 RepID=UPI00368F6682